MSPREYERIENEPGRFAQGRWVVAPTWRRVPPTLDRGQTGKIERYFPATENYLVAIDGMPDMIVLTDAQMEAV